MRKIEIEGNCALFLRHDHLINSMYSQYTEDSTEYHLNPQLFDFHPKARSTEEEVTAVDGSSAKSRKRKRSLDGKESLAELQTKIDKFLEAIRKDFPQIHTPSNNLERVWEEPCEFPQLHGANATKSFQSVRFNNHAYLIPPQCRFFNHDATLMRSLLPQLRRYDLIVMDMPWRNKYIRRLKRARSTLSYKMLDNEQLSALPIAQLTHNRSIVAIWCTNAVQHQSAVLNTFLPLWQLRLLHSLKWLKLNTAGELISDLRPEGHKQPYETLYIACHRDCAATDFSAITEVEMLLSVPSIVHSHKPPLLPWLKPFLRPIGDEVHCLEIFARYLQPQFTSLGLEVLKLMDERLYEKMNNCNLTNAM